jgi:hypothetical protein
VNKLFLIGATVAGAALLARRLAPKFATIDWAPKLAAMPDTAAPNWPRRPRGRMFANIAAIRANTERILELLESSPPGADGETRYSGPFHERPEEASWQDSARGDDA